MKSYYLPDIKGTIKCHQPQEYDGSPYTNNVPRSSEIKQRLKAGYEQFAINLTHKKSFQAFRLPFVFALKNGGEVRMLHFLRQI